MYVIVRITCLFYQVVSERLYSTPCSSTSSLTDSEGSVVTKEPEAEDYNSGKH